MTNLFKKLSVWATLLVIGVIPTMAQDAADFDPNQLYTIRNKVTGTSIIMGAPNEEAEEEIMLGPGLGGAMFKRGETGWQILSPCGGVLVYWTKNVFYFRVLSESDYEFEIQTYPGGYYTLICQDSDGGSYYIASDGEWIITIEMNSFNEKALWEISPLPDGAIIDVPKSVEMANRTFLNTDQYERLDNIAWRVELSDDMGFACAHEVDADLVIFTRELNVGWQGFCAPIVLDQADWEPFGELYRLGEAVEETDEDGNATLSLRLVEAEAFEPNKPYLIKVEHPGTMSVQKELCIVSPSGTAQSDIVETGNTRMELACVYDFTEVPFTSANDATKSYALSGGVFKRPQSAGVKLKPYRVILTVTSTGEHPSRIAVKTDSDEQVTFIDAIESAPTQRQWHDISGRPATERTRGLLISPDRKVIKR